jgi:DNA mismatch endonuclease (patch repair protein)
MVDITDPATRSRMMSAIRSKYTKPELEVRRALHRRGLRYRLHAQDLPGRPDIVFRTRKVVVDCRGCYWHQHGPGCRNSSMPDSLAWQAKLRGNVERDKRNLRRLLADGWRVAIVWECTTRKSHRSGNQAVYDRLARWILAGRSRLIVL